MMTHNRMFINHLLMALNKYGNKKMYFEKAFASDEMYKAFMRGVARAIYKKAGMEEIKLPLIWVESDHRKSTPYIIVLHEFDVSFVKERYDVYYFSILIDEVGNLRLFTYELDYTLDNKEQYVCCEYFENGERKEYSTRERLHLDAFCREMSLVIE